MAYHHTNTSQIALNLARRTSLPVLSQLAIQFANTVVKWDDRYKARRKLGTMPDYLLDDMGITRKQVEDEISKPLWRL